MKMSMIFNIDEIIDVILNSGEIAKKHQSLKKVSYELKNDKSKVSDADIEINNYIINFLAKKYPQIKVLSEEDNIVNQKKVIEDDTFFIIDPIDGTSSFIEKGDFFTINLTLVYKNLPQISIIYAPNINLMLCAELEKTYKVEIEGDFKRKEEIKNNNKINFNKRLKVLTTKRKSEIADIEYFLSKYKLEYDIQHVSSSIKFCYVALNEADVYIRNANIKLWDIVAGFHISKNAGLDVLNIKGENLYNIFLNKSYLNKISEDSFKVDKFIISNNKLNWVL